MGRSKIAICLKNSEIKNIRLHVNTNFAFIRLNRLKLSLIKMGGGVVFLCVLHVYFNKTLSIRNLDVEIHNLKDTIQ